MRLIIAGCYDFIHHIINRFRLSRSTTGHILPQVTPKNLLNNVMANIMPVFTITVPLQSKSSLHSPVCKSALCHCWTLQVALQHPLLYIHRPTHHFKLSVESVSNSIILNPHYFLHSYNLPETLQLSA